MKRTVLYYPTINIPDGEWLRRSLLYFDELASIVPRRLYMNGEQGELLIDSTPEVDFLISTNLFRAIAPDLLWLRAEGDDWELAHRFSDDFLAALNAPEFKRSPQGQYVDIHRGKMAQMILSRLEAQHLTKSPEPDEPWREWISVDESAARLYMAMLAQYMADLDIEATTPATDSKADEDVIYRAKSSDGFPCIETRFLQVVPTPRPDVSLADILEFKAKYESELLTYREAVDTLQQHLSEADTNSAVKSALLKFEERQRKELLNLTGALDDRGVATFWGSLKALIKTSTPALWLGIAATTAPAAPAASVAFGTFAAAAAVETTAYLIDRRNEKRAANRNLPFAYVQHARREGII